MKRRGYVSLNINVSGLAAPGGRVGGGGEVACGEWFPILMYKWVFNWEKLCRGGGDRYRNRGLLRAGGYL